jgi:pimeloyl-ACP methyl ester carboxylesterase
LTLPSRGLSGPLRAEIHLPAGYAADPDRRYRTLGSRQGRLLVGLSLGGYSALHLGITHPEAFGFIASLSGVVGIAGWTSQDEGFLPPRLRTQLHQALGEPGSPGRQARDLATLLDSLPPAAIRGLPFLRLDCGREDWFFEANRRLSRRMAARGIPHAFQAPPGRHDEAFWRRQLEEVLRDWVNLPLLDPPANRSKVVAATCGTSHPLWGGRGRRPSGGRRHHAASGSDRPVPATPPAHVTLCVPCEVFP